MDAIQEHGPLTRSDDAAASELVGTLLLMAIAVGLGAVFILAMFSIPGPAPTSNTAVQAFILPTSANELVLEHRGGPAVPITGLVATVTVNGSSTRYVVGDDLGGVWSVRSPSGTSKSATESFALGDQAIFSSPTLYKASASVLVVDQEAGALTLGETTVQTADTTAPTLFSSRTRSTTTVEVNFTEQLRAVSAADFTIGGATPTSAALTGNGSSALFTMATPFATDARPVVATIASPAGTSDSVGNLLAAMATSTPTDGVAPVITAGPSITGTPSQNLANVTWTTASEAGTSVVDFGTTLSYGRTISDTSLVTTHPITLTQLSPGTLYFYRVSTTDAAGNTASSSVAITVNFTTASPAGGGGGGDAFLGNAQTWTALQTFGTNAALDGSTITSGTVSASRLPTAAAGVAGIIPTTGATNAMIASGAAIAYSKLDLASSIVNADIAAGAAIADTKLGTISTAGKVSDSALSANVARLGTAQTWTALQTFGTNAALDGSTITSGTVSASRLPTAAAGVAGIIPTTGATNAMIASGAAIAYSKLNLASSIVNTDIASGAAIAYSKLDLASSIVNADIAAGAAIADTKLATISTAGKVSDSALSGNVVLLTGSQTLTGVKTFNAGAFKIQQALIQYDPPGTSSTATITLPVAEADANYGVVCLASAGTRTVTLVSTKTTTDFVLTFSGSITGAQRVDCFIYR